MDIEQDGFITSKEFREGMGTIMNDETLADALFSIMDNKHQGKIDFKEYIDAMAVLMKGSSEQQLECMYFIYHIINHSTQLHLNCILPHLNSLCLEQTLRKSYMPCVGMLTTLSLMLRSSKSIGPCIV
jgi:hypothetical protein